MKSLVRFLVFVILVIFTPLASCKKHSGSMSVPQVQTDVISEITRSTAVSGGNVINDGGSLVVSRGVCWSTNSYPTFECERTIQGGSTGWFRSSIISLNPDTRYFVRAYAINETGTGYGNELTFKTNPISVPVLTAGYQTIIAGTALLNGEVTDDGGSPVTDRGFCWAVSMPHPTINELHTHNGTGTGIFTDTIKNIPDSTYYYVRAYAINAAGTAYSNEFPIYLGGGCKK